MSITFEQVSFSYVPLSKRQKKAGEKQKYALRNVSFELRDGEFLAIAGHTGSGKSTLVQHLNGLANPTEGTVLWNGQNLADKRVATQARGDIGVVFQYPEHQLFAASVAQDVAFGPRNLGLTEDEVNARVREALELVHLDYDQLAERSPFELSGGQQRRVAFAGVLAMRPTTLVLDEPVAGLDPASRADFLSLIEDLHVQHGLTVVMVSHNMNDIARLADRLLVMHEGEVAFLGSPEEIFTYHAKELRQIGLGIPHAQRLANELRDLGFDLPEKLYDPQILADEIVTYLEAFAAKQTFAAKDVEGNEGSREVDSHETSPYKVDPREANPLDADSHKMNPHQVDPHDGDPRNADKPHLEDESHHEGEER